MQLIGLFREENCQITFASTAAISEKAFNLKSENISVENIFLNDSSFDAFIKKLNPSIVLFDRYITEEQFGWRVSEICPNALKILDTEDLHFFAEGAGGSGEKRQIHFRGKPFFRNRKAGSSKYPSLRSFADYFGI